MGRHVAFPFHFCFLTVSFLRTCGCRSATKASGRLMERAMLPQLETPRLVLRELCMDDALALQAFQTRPSYLRCQAMEPSDFKDGIERVTRYMKYRGEGESRRLYDFVARLHNDGEIVGHGSLSRSAPGIASLGLGID